MCVLSLIGGSFATEVWHLIMAQGLFFGMGVMISDPQHVDVVVKQGRAYGIL